MPETSIVITSFNRADLLRRTLESIYRQIRMSRFPTIRDVEVLVVEDGSDDGWTRGVCEQFGVRYFQRERRPGVIYSNPAVPVNIGLRRATGDVIILQNAECEHISENAIEELTTPHRTDPNVAIFAGVMAMNEKGEEDHWYVHPLYSCRPFFFCGSVRREHFHRLRGMDEDYKFYGCEDDDFALRMAEIGIKFWFRDEIRVNHNFHKGTACFGFGDNCTVFQEKCRQMACGEIGPERNLDREWGSLDS